MKANKKNSKKSIKKKEVKKKYIDPFADDDIGDVMHTLSPKNYIGNSKKPIRTFDSGEAILIGDLKRWVEQNNDFNEYTNIGRLVKTLQKAKHKQNFEILTSKTNKNQFVIIGTFEDGLEEEREKKKKNKPKKK